MTPHERAVAEVNRAMMSDALRALAEILESLAVERMADVTPRLRVHISGLQRLLRN